MSKEIKLVSDTIDRADINALIEWLQQAEIPQLTKGNLTRMLEDKWAKKVGSKYSVFVNSGSSSILLTLAALKHSQKLKNTKIIVPALSWATDVSSPLLLGLEPILCDCNLKDLSCDLEQLETLFKTHQPSAFILVSVLGLVPNMDKIITLCNNYDVILLEDVCEGMGSTYEGQYLGTFGFASFFSMYFGHHLSTIEGGFINTDDEEFYHLLLMMRSHGWDRDLPHHIQTELRTKYKVDEFSALYEFYVPGFNLRSTDLQAFIGLRAIDKLDTWCNIRNRNFLEYQKLINTNMIDIDVTQGLNFISSLAYPIIHPKKDSIVAELTRNNIAVRPLIAGNMARKVMCILETNVPNGYFPNAELVDKFGFYLPNHQDLLVEEIKLICDIINYWNTYYNLNKLNNH